jgi:hypothetical protein
VLHELDVRRNGDVILLGIALEDAILDITTTEMQLQQCLKMLDAPSPENDRPQIGNFGPYPASVNVGEMCSIFIDGPRFDPPRELCAAIYLKKDELRRAICHALFGTEWRRISS